MNQQEQLKEIRDQLRTTLNFVNNILKEGSSEAKGSLQGSEAPDSPPISEKPKEVKRRLPVPMDDPNWPVALPTGAIVANDSQKWARANTIFTKFETFRGKTLDFGCGEGHTTVALHDQNIQVVGYDNQVYENWVKISSSDELFTADWDTIVRDGPYDSILLHDVLDHVEGEEVEEALEKVDSVLAEKGRVYVMTHPYSSRHGGHLYTTTNKAYLHLLLDDEDIAQNFPDAPPNQQIVKPQGQYQKYLTSRFTILDKKVIPQTVEPWVITNLLPAIKERWYGDLEKSKIEKILKIGGIYYTLEKLANPV